MRLFPRTLKTPAAPWVAGIAGVLLTLFAMRLAGAYNETETGRAIEQSASSLEREISKRVGLFQYGLFGVRGAVVTAGEGGLNRQMFARYVASRNHAAEFPGARGFGIIRRIAETDEDAFLAQVRAEGQPDFSIRPFTPHDGDRFVVQVIEPEKDNLAIIGRDIASDPIPRDTALDALQSGKSRLTPPLDLSEPGMAGRRSMLLVLPLYRGSQHLDLKGLREDSGYGWAFARLVTDEVFAGLTFDQPGLHFSVTDLGAEGGRGELYSDIPREGASTGLPGSAREFDIFGRRWRLAVVPDKGFLSLVRQVSVKLVAAAGLVLTVLGVLGALLWGRIRERDRAAIEQRTRLAAIIDSANDGIIGKTLDGVVTSWNRAAQGIFGYSAEEAIGRHMTELIIPPERHDEAARILERVRAGMPTAHFETVRRHKDGHPLQVSVTVSPVWDDSGRVIGASKTVRDISARKQAEARILELNATLERQVGERTREIVRMSAWQSAILNNAGYAIIAVDENWVITIFNPAAEALLGYRADEVINHTPEMFHDPDELAARRAERAGKLGRDVLLGRDILGADDESLEEAREWTYVRKDGERVPVLLKVTLLKDQYGDVFGSISIAIDLTERKRAVEELRQANQELRAAEETLRDSEFRFRGAFDSAPQGMALVSMQGRFLQVNAALCGMLGYSEEELLATDFQHITHPQDVSRGLTLMRDLVENRADSYQIEKRYIHKNGRIIWALLSVSIVRSSSGEPIQVVSQILDFTEKHEAEAVLIEARHQAEAADRAKSEFLANMSHEIRTPMNAILGLSHILSGTELSSEQRDYTGKIATAGRSLLGILNDILDYSKIEANRLDLETIDFKLSSVLDDLAVIMSVNGRDLGLELTITADKAIPRNLRGDPSRLQQVLINLAGNAIKFTKSGTVAVRVELQERHRDQVVVKFSVKDSGIGMAPETLQLLFQPFSQADATTTRRFGGTGLGLAISKRLVELMGGTIGVESKLGEGSIFWFTIPFIESRLNGPGPELPRTLNLLIVDDNEDARLSLLETVETLGWSGEAVGSGAAAIERMGGADDEKFDVILVDWKMPGLDGLETALRIRQAPICSKAPAVLMVTGFGRDEWQNAPHADCADAVVVKPVTESGLASAVAQATGAAGQNDGRAGKAGPRLSGLRILVVEDNSLNQEVARKILQNEGALVEVLGDGRHAVNYLREGRDGVDIVLMDAQMPVMDGFEASTYVRQTLQIHDLPIIAVTAGVRASDKEKCLAAGMTDFVAKPLDVEVLITAILRHVSPRPDAMPFVEAAPRPMGQGPSLAELAKVLDLDVKRLRAISEDGDDTLLPMLRRLGESAHGFIKSLREDLAGKDRKAAARHVHTLRGSSANFGATVLAALSAEIEDAIGAGRTARQLAGRIGQLQAEADKFSAALAALAPVEKAPAAQGSGEVDGARLEELVGLLRSKNFAALDLFAELASDLRGAYGEARYDELQSAIDGLAFDKALGVITLAKAEAPPNLMAPVKRAHPR